jgi:signal transduction histidine kinase/CheY-like chemotaxis protein/HPt (histidine-containing phosphotransfer) domain-containing protein
MEARNVLLLEFHQELTEFRRLLKASYYNPVWIDAASEAERREFEVFIARSHSRMIFLADEYIDSVMDDELFYQHLDNYSNEDVIDRMRGVESFVNEVFETFENNFFLGGTNSRDKGNVLELTPRIEDDIRYLRRLDASVDASIQLRIENTLALNRAITLIAITFALVLSLFLAWITVKSLSQWVKNIENTAIKSLQESTIAEANSQAKSRFLARMSHEIRTPVSAVIGVSEIQLQKKDLPPDVEDAFHRVYTSSSILIGILNDILDLSKIEAGKMDIILAEYDVASFIQDVLQMHVVGLDSKKFTFKVNIDPTLPAALVGDVLRLKQVLNNILSNAFKYTEIGVVEFTIKCVAHPKGDMINMVVTIRDTGLGMTKEQVEMLLKEEYMRFHEGENRHVFGTGLGMPIAMNLVDMMGAHINIESHIKAGTKVTLQIPQQVASLDDIGPKAAEALSKLETVNKKVAFTPESLPHGKVLVVDDVETNLFVAKGLLGLYSLQIETFNNALDAIEKIKGGAEYDIIFMDHMMPELNGMDATKILRDIGYKKPVVALTANALVGQAEEFLSNGFDDFIAKPIQTRYLHQVIMKYIDRRKGDRAYKGDDIKEIQPLTPNKKVVDDYYGSPEVIKMIRDEFYDKQKDTVTDIVAALKKKDTETARRLAHTIKGMAHMMKETRLSNAAQIVESAIYEGGEPSADQIAALENEMKQVLAQYD